CSGSTVAAGGWARGAAIAAAAMTRARRAVSFMRILYVAQGDRFPQRRQRIARRDELVREVARETGADDRAAHRRPVHLLRPVQLVTPGHAARVVVADVLVLIRDRVDQIP